MTHFSPEELAAYKKCLSEESKSSIIENHLLECDDCLAAFLDLVDDVEIAEAACFIPDGFTAGIASQLEPYPVRRTVTATGTAWRRKRANLITAYASAAAVTLFLAGNGVFSSLSSAAAGNIQNQDVFERPFAMLAAGERILIDEYGTRLDQTNQRYLNLFYNETTSLKEVNK